MAPLEVVKSHFKKYGLLDHHIHFIKGYFENTLPVFQPRPQNEIALLRLDGDLYNSTMVVMNHLYPKLQPGGWVIIDDYFWRPIMKGVSNLPLCREAIDEYRLAHNITEPINLSGTPSWQKKI